MQKVYLYLFTKYYSLYLYSKDSEFGSNKLEIVNWSNNFFMSEKSLQIIFVTLEKG